MNPIIMSNDPTSTGGYVPYFYQSGLHQVYGGVPTKRPSTPDRQHVARYDFSAISPRDSLFADPQTVEQIVSRGYFAAPVGDPITAIISDKKHTSRLGLDDVISQVRQRYEIYERNLHQVELAKCAAINAIYHHEAYRGPGSADSRQHYAKHKAIQGLYEQERLERTALWKDISRLKLLLPESAQQYLTAHRKMTVLNTPPGDGP